MSGYGVNLVLSCRNCRGEIGEVSTDELKHLVEEDERGPLCFDCDPDSASTTPNIFWNWKKEDVFVIADQEFFVTPDEKNIVPFFQSHARVSALASVLSSYTYLNKTSKKWDFVRSGIVGFTCLVCEGKGHHTTGRITVNCSFCDGSGYLIKSITIPRWMIGEVMENA